MSNFWFEALKLAAQMVGAIVVARFTVIWALRRYKAEKIWERRLAAHTDVLAAIGLMRGIYAQWIKDLEKGDPVDVDALEEQSDRCRKAWQTLRSAISTGQLLLSQDAKQALTTLDSQLSETFDFEGSPSPILQKAIESLDLAFEALLQDGRNSLEISKY